MATAPGILAIDQGTTSSRAIVFDAQSSIIATAQQEFEQLFPEDGWVEHDPEAIWQTTLATAREALASAADSGIEVNCIGITNQRETTLVWDSVSGEPVYNAIVWQDRRTHLFCESLQARGLEADIHARTGLLIDPYFSASKLAWILEHVEGARQRAERGELRFGTVDCFLIWRLTAGASHNTDATNASRTGLFNIHSQQWDPTLLQLYNIPAIMMPEVKDSADDFGNTEASLLGRCIPITGVAGDQQAAAFGQCCFEAGAIKSTYGTGCFVMMNTGEKAVASANKLLTTVAYRLHGKPYYAIEGSIFIAGAAMQWLRDGLGIISSAQESARLAESLTDNRGVYFVPALTGLGAPYWKPTARGAIFGLTRDTGPADIARAALEAVCYLSADLFAAMAADGIAPASIRVDGGMSQNNWLLQYLADVLDLTVQRPAITETTALGAAYLAGYQTGIFTSLEDLAARWHCQAAFEPSMDTDQREHLLAGWHTAVKQVINSA